MRANNKFRFISLLFSSDKDRSSDSDDDMTMVLLLLWFSLKEHGFTSNYGARIVIEVMTGRVLDFEVLSKYVLSRLFREWPKRDDS